MSALTLILAALGVYRVSRMVAREDGPADVFLRTRSALYVRRRGSSIERGVSCPLCSSFWLSWPIAWIAGAETPRQLMLVALGLAGAAVLLHLTEKE